MTALNSTTVQQRDSMRVYVLGLVRRIQRDSLLRNSLYMMATTVVTAALGYLFWIAAARTFTEYQVGLVSSLISAVTLTVTLSNLGFGAYLIQTLPKRTSGYDWSLTFNTAQVAVTLLSTLGAGITLLIFGLTGQYAIVLSSSLYLLMFVFGVVLSNVFLMQDSAFIAERAAGQTLTHNSVLAVSKIVLLSGFLLLPRTEFGLLGSWFFANALAALAGIALIVRVKHDYQLAHRGMIGQFRASLTSLIGHHFIQAGGMLPTVLLPVMVATILSPVDNAYFYVVWMLRVVYSTISVSVAASLFAEGSHEAADLGKKTKKAARIIGLLLIPVIVIVLLGSNSILGVFGTNYAIHGTALSAILAISVIPDAITNVYVAVLRVQRRLRAAGLLNIGMGVLVIMLAWVLMPRMGINGVGWAWLLGETIGCVAVAIDVVWQRRNSKPATR